MNTVAIFENLTLHDMVKPCELCQSNVAEPKLSQPDIKCVK
jgi:hypothetical protein